MGEGNVMPGDLVVAGNSVFVSSGDHFLRAVEFLRIIKDVEMGRKCLTYNHRKWEKTFPVGYYHS